MLEQFKQRVQEQQSAVSKLRVYKRRLESDDGFEFRAAQKSPGKDWQAASHGDLIEIACRALTGNY